MQQIMQQITQQITVNEQQRHPLGFHRSIDDILEKPPFPA